MSMNTDCWSPRGLFRGATPLWVVLALLLLPLRANGVDVSGTVHFQGLVVFATTIPGIAEEDLTVSVKPTTEATGNGEKCSISLTTADNPDTGGMYPDAGDVSATILLERGGPTLPDGKCVVTVQATGTDGGSVSARGSQTIFLDQAQIGANATVAVPNIIVRESKSVAGSSSDCLKWVKKQLGKRAKCNFLLLKKGPTAATKCKDAGLEPVGCDPGNFVEAILAFAHDSNDQQTDPNNAEGVDFEALKDQVKCQKRFGKAAANYTNKRLKLVNNDCVGDDIDDQDCRDDRSQQSKSKLDQIDKCSGDQMTDVDTGRIVPDVAPPCDSCIDGLGAIDRKCLKACFQLVLDDLGDGIIGDIPVCGNGILQGGESCDDGNLANGDCCSANCTVEAGSPEGPMGDATCTDALDNDCDGDVDGADPDCL